jgi:hypothetical protein
MASSTEVIPIDKLVFAGFQRRFQQVFNCKCAYSNVHETTKILERIFGEGQHLEYPYAYFVIQNIAHNKETYNTQMMVRKGLVVNVDSNSTAQKVRVMPANFDLEINYVTNDFDSNEQGSVIAFARRWLLAYRAGYLKFTINYGRLQFNVALTMPESLPIPTRENVVETETSYKLTTTLTLHGYISEPILALTGKVNTVNLQTSVQGVNPQLVSSQSFIFPTSSGNGGQQ